MATNFLNQNDEIPSGYWFFDNCKVENIGCR